MHLGSSLSLSYSSSWPSMCVRSLHLDPPFLLLAPPSTPFLLPQLHEVLYWCRIPDNGWRRTVLTRRSEFLTAGINKLVTDLSNNKEGDNNEQETSEMQFEDFALKTNVFSFASRSKAKAKPRRRNSVCSSTRTVPMWERTWTDIEPEDYIRPSLTQCQNNWVLFFVMLIYLQKKMEGLNSGDERIIFGTILCSTLVWWNVEEYNGKRRKKQEKISFLHWSTRTRNSLFPISSRSFRTQSHWSFITGQSRDSGQFLQVHSSRWMCNQFTLHHEFRIGSTKTKLEQMTDGILHVCRSYEQRTQIRTKLTWKPRVLHGTIRTNGRNIKTWCIGSTSNVLKRNDFSSIKRSNAIILYDTLPAYCIPQAIMMETGEIIYEKAYASSRLPPKISFIDKWRKELGSEVAGGSEDSQQIQPKSKTQLSSTERLVKSEQPSGSSAQEIDKRVLFGCESTNVSTGDLWRIVCQCPLNV